MWRRHAIVTVPSPYPNLPKELPAGTRTLRHGQQATTHLVLKEGDWDDCAPCYWGRWTYNQDAPNPRKGTFYGPVAHFSIDWSLTP